MSGTDKVKQVQGQVDEVTGLMKKNIDTALRNQENLDVLKDKTDNLSKDAHVFQKQAVTLKRNMWWKNAKLTLLIFFVVAVIITVIVLIALGVSKKL